jgi:hypothetical protein
LEIQVQEVKGQLTEIKGQLQDVKTQLLDVRNQLNEESQVNPIPSDQIVVPSSVACAQDARLCPDGTYVGRTGPNCEFMSCPNGIIK